MKIIRTKGLEVCI